MSQHKHEGFTPGPWQCDLGERYRVVDGHRNTVAVAQFTHLLGRREEPEVAANARLFADAPSLYADYQALTERVAKLEEALHVVCAAFSQPKKTMAEEQSSILNAYNTARAALRDDREDGVKR